MNDAAIQVEDLGKRYRIGLAGNRPTNFREAVLSFAGSPFRYLNQMLREPSQAEILWALRNVSFQVRRGETIGIIGRNGSGKSTLLKILARITDPTEGRAEIRGRVGSLLEIGTGFHPELTGRENIYLSGAILGMNKAEIDRKFDAIVAFAETARFLDTPVKRYSSGMYVRLGFSVAAHLEPDVLLVDEVMAVGDTAFQQKCLKKIQDLARQGTTSLFVSHNMPVVGALAGRCVYLQSGAIVFDGDVSTAIGLYLTDTLKEAEGETGPAGSDGTREEKAEVGHSFSIVAADPDGQSSVNQGDDLHISIRYRAVLPPEHVHFHLNIWTEQGVLVTCADSRMVEKDGFPAGEEGTVTCVLRSLNLSSGRYVIRGLMVDPSTDCALAVFGWEDKRVCAFFVKPKAVNMTTGMVWVPTCSDFGVVQLPFRWHHGEETLGVGMMRGEP
jgi:lipopolysaccharide transport system ATP-binding protein